MEIGVHLPHIGPLANRDALIDFARFAEERGFDSLWVSDHVVVPRTIASRYPYSPDGRFPIPPDLPFLEPLSTLEFVAAVTQRAKLGTTILVLPMRNPIVTAKQVACIDVLSGGRLILGIGVGAAAVTHNVDFEVLGVPRNDKYSRTRDYLRAMREIWTKEKPSYSGKFITFPETEINPKPVQKPFPPIWVGGGGPKSVDIAAEFATGWLPPWIPPGEYPERIKALKDLAREKGRGDVDFTIATEVYVCVGKTHEDAWSTARRTLTVLPQGFAEDATPQAIEASGLVGSTSEVREKLEQYVDAGVTHYEMKFIYRNVPHLIEQLRMFATDIAPAFR